MMSTKLNIIFKTNLFAPQLDSKYFEDKGGDLTLM